MTEMPEFPAPAPAPLSWLLRLLALVCVLLAMLGVVLPGLPPVLFTVMAGWAAARSWPGLYRWLWRAHIFGPMLRHWASGRRIRWRDKVSASIVLVAGAVIVLAVRIPAGARLSGLLVMVCVLAWVWYWPEPEA
ncbi:YbaN family protein [Comamonas sp. NLF-1-9]|uniref:YbaN family protein n=1 Tax=Comamonas sp. NLF-1-9 TaxID=2853163 RepID=UPI001C48CF31|nr:YbaN family protein [Comamonas sp. NLF-1-9]QXL84996.1 YbaN family protein [Comamonas sp. NLF-1-9]